MSSGIRLKYARSLELLATLEAEHGSMQDRLEGEVARKADEIATLGLTNGQLDGRVRELESKLVELEAALLKSSRALRNPPHRLSRAKLREALV